MMCVMTVHSGHLSSTVNDPRVVAFPDEPLQTLEDPFAMADPMLTG